MVTTQKKSRVKVEDNGQASAELTVRFPKDLKKLQSISKIPELGAKADQKRMGTIDFRKQLMLLMQNPTDSSILMTITPDMAKEMLHYNLAEESDRINRKILPRTIELYRKQMAEGRWKRTGETIIFSKKLLLDGQHRLYACIAANNSFTTDVIFGIDEDAFSFLDSGKKRSSSDLFSIHNVSDPSIASAGTNWIWRYRTYNVDQRGFVPRTAAELYELFNSLTPSPKISLVYGQMAKKVKFVTPSVIMAAHNICSEKDGVRAKTFFTQLVTGENIPKGSNITKLRRTIEKMRTQHASIRGEVVFALIIKTWNAEVSGEELKSLEWRSGRNPNEKFPELV